MRRILGVLAALFAQSSMVHSASYHELKGVGLVDIRSTVDERGRDCGLDADKLKGTLLLPLQANTKMHELGTGDPSKADVVVTLHVSTAEGSTLCGHAVNITVAAFDYMKLKFEAVPQFQTIVLFSGLNVAMDEKGSDKLANEIVEGLSKKLAAQWQADNQ